MLDCHKSNFTLFYWNYFMIQITLTFYLLLLCNFLISYKMLFKFLSFTYCKIIFFSHKKFTRKFRFSLFPHFSNYFNVLIFLFSFKLHLFPWLKYQSLFEFILNLYSYLTQKINAQYFNHWLTNNLLLYIMQREIELN